MSKIKVFKEARCLVLPDIPQFHQVFPHGKHFQFQGKTYFGVRHGLPETRLLRRLGAQVPDPMRVYYDWPRKPWEAQLGTASMLSMYRRAYCLNDMGTGKTFSALAAADFLMREREVRRVLVVAPMSTLAMTWRNEILRWFQHRSCVILHASGAEQRRKRLDTPCDFYIINHDGVEVLIDALEQRSDIDLVILDELAVYRNGRPAEKVPAFRDLPSGERIQVGEKWQMRNRRWSHAKRLLKRRKYAWGMTGAPCPNEPLDAWAQVQLLTPQNVSWSWAKFRDDTMLKISNYTWVARHGAMDRVYAAMQPAVRYSMADCIDLPPVVLETRQVPLSKLQQRAHDDLLKAVARDIQIVTNDKGTKTARLSMANEAVVLSRICQIACGFVYDVNKDVVDLKAKPRLQEILATIQAASHKVLVFVPYVGAIKGVTEFLIKNKIDAVSVYGGTSRSARDQIFSAFQETPQYRVIVAQPGTMSHGLTLTAANVTIWYGPIDSLDTYIQANRRTSRPGQQNTQLILHLAGSHAENRIYARLAKKERLQDILLDLFEHSPTTGDDYGRVRPISTAA